MRKSALEQYIIERWGLDPEWSISQWEEVTSPAPAHHVRGAVFERHLLHGIHEVYDYDKPIPGSEWEFTVPSDEYLDWLRKREATSGTCLRCNGVGSVVAGFSMEYGANRTECPRCKGTGRPLHAMPTEHT